MHMFLLAFKIGAVKAPGIPKIEIPPKYTGQFPENTLVPWETQLVHQNGLVVSFLHKINARYLSRDGYVPASVEIGAVKGKESQKLKYPQNTRPIPWKYTSSLGNSASAPNRTGRAIVHNINARYLFRDGYVPASVEIGAVKGPGIPKIEITQNTRANSVKIH